MTLIRIVKILAVLLGVGTLFVTLSALFRSSAITLPTGFHMPGVAMEFARTEKELQTVLSGANSPEKMRSGLNLDSRLVIPLYVVFFIVFASWLKQANPQQSNLLIVAIIIFILAAGISDYLENFFATQTLNAYEKGSLTDAMFFRNSIATTAKWGLIAFTMFLVALGLFKNNLNFVGSVYLLNALIFAIGLVWHRPIVEWGFTMMGLTWLITLLVK